MNALFNTTFFFSPAIETRLRAELRARWVKACEVCGCRRPMCLQMEADEGICRLAVQTPFPSRAEAERFAAEIASPLLYELTARFGEEAFTAFSTIMEETEL